MMDRNAESPAHGGDPGTEDAQSGRLSRFLALVLRHRAYQFKLPIDDEGFVPIEPLLELAHTRQGLEEVSREDLEALADKPGRKRFEIRDDAIRATYGHSFHRPIRYPEATPPERLYLAVPRSQLPDVRAHGLRPEGRQYIHLSEDREEALEVGRHKTTEITVVEVLAGDAAGNGVPFHKPTDGLYLATQVPARYLDVEVRYGRLPRKTRRRR